MRMATSRVPGMLATVNRGRAFLHDPLCKGEQGFSRPHVKREKTIVAANVQATEHRPRGNGWATGKGQPWNARMGEVPRDLSVGFDGLHLEGTHLAFGKAALEAL